MTILDASSPRLRSMPNIDYAAFKKKDQELYDIWAKTKSREDLSRLVNSLMPIAGKEIQRASGTLPQSALTSEAKKWVIQAIKTYQPGRGAVLSTHVTNYLQKVRRLNYTYQKVARLPESRQLQFTEFNNAKTWLEETLGREPTEEELAAKLGWSKKQTVKFREMMFRDWGTTGASLDSPYHEYDTTPAFMKELRSLLTEQEAKLMDLILGDEKASNAELARKMNTSTSMVSVLKASIKKKTEKVKHLL